MGELQQLRFGDLGQLFDGPHATPTRVTEGPYFLNIASLKSGRLDLSESDHVSDDDFAKWTKRVTPRENDLLFSYETRLGEAALMPGWIVGCLGRRMALLRPDLSIVDPRFLLYYYLSPKFQQTIAMNTIHGATVPRIGLATMPDWSVELPDLPTQRAIAEVLGALDDKIAANERVVATSLSLVRTEFRDACMDGQALRLGDVTELVTRGAAPSYVDEGGMIVLNQKCVRDQLVSLAPARRTTESARRVERTLQVNDVLVNSTGMGTLGRAARWTDTAIATADSHMTIVRFDRGLVSQECGGYAVLAIEDQIEGLAEGSTGQTELRRELLQGLTIQVPQPGDQLRLSERIRVVDDLVMATSMESAALARTRDQLLPVLMSGKLSVDAAETRGSERL